MKSIIIDFTGFLRSGKTSSPVKKGKGLALDFFKVLAMHEVLTLLALLLVIVFAIFVDVPRNSAQAGLTTLAPLWAFLIPSVIAPVIEEFTYRFWLKFSRISLSTSFAFLAYFIANNLLNSNYYRIDDTFIYELLIVGVVFISVWLLLAIKSVYNSLQSVFSKYPAILLYVSAIVFAFIHIANFPLTGFQYLYSPIIVLVQFVMGIVLAYARVRYGILFPVLIHIIHNSIL